MAMSAEDKKWVAVALISLVVGAPILAYGLNLQTTVSSGKENLIAGFVQFFGMIALIPAITILPDLRFSDKSVSNETLAKIPGWTMAMLFCGFVMVGALAILISTRGEYLLAALPLGLIPLAIGIGMRMRSSMSPGMAAFISIAILAPVIP